MSQKQLSLGILSTLRPASDLPFGGQTEPFFEIISMAEKRGCQTFVFTLDDINWEEATVNGYYPEEDQWEQQLFPLPSVIYNRLPNRTIEQKEENQQALSLLKKKYGKRFFNPCFLNKWDIYRILSKKDSTRRLLPETRELNNENLLYMLNKYPSVYLKPKENSLGIGIFKIILDRQTSSISCTGVNKLNHTMSLEDFMASWHEFLVSNQPYLAQQGIPLALFRGRPFDFRVLYQKNTKNLWAKTGFATRVAGPDSITTHLLYGGSRHPAPFILNRVFGKEAASSITDKISSIGKQIGPLIEQAYGHSFGELEMDIGLDETGTPWIFEVNSKPFKFDEPVIRSRSLKRLLDYVDYLASS